MVLSLGAKHAARPDSAAHKRTYVEIGCQRCQNKSFQLKPPTLKHRGRIIPEHNKHLHQGALLLQWDSKVTGGVTVQPALVNTSLPSPALHSALYTLRAFPPCTLPHTHTLITRTWGPANSHRPVQYNRRTGEHATRSLLSFPPTPQLFHTPPPGVGTDVPRAP